MWTPEYFVRYISFPAKIEGVTIPNDDGTFDIYINANFSIKKKKEILEHELCHINENHFYNDILPINLIEQEANESKADNLPNILIIQKI